MLDRGDALGAEGVGGLIAQANKESITSMEQRAASEQQQQQQPTLSCKLV